VRFKALIISYTAGFYIHFLYFSFGFPALPLFILGIFEELQVGTRVRGTASERFNLLDLFVFGNSLIILRFITLFW
jgi:hypothetical protein